MSEYTPDVWHILKLEGYKDSEGPVYKVLAGWYGGYTGSDSWKLNSGITEIIDQGDYYDIKGHSGSVYKCYKGIERFSGLTSSMLAYWQKESDIKIEAISIEDTIKFLRE